MFFFILRQLDSSLSKTDHPYPLLYNTVTIQAYQKWKKNLTLLY
jgi:hypothetical protein